MSYDHNLYIGWTARFKASQRQKEVGLKQVKACPTSKKHPSTGAFCPVCGEKIVTREEKLLQSYAKPYHLHYGESEEDVREKTLGQVGLADLKALGEIKVVFDEFLHEDKSIVLAPGYVSFRDVSRGDGFYEKLPATQAPSQEWINQLKKVFDVEDVEVEYGVVMEVC